MRAALRLGGLVLEGGVFRVRDAIGIVSYRKGTDKWHNLLFDFDGNLLRNTRFDWREKTLHGFHAVKLGNYSLKRAMEELVEEGSDPHHVLMGFKRGYWFLECFSLPPKEVLRHLRFMRIERVAKSVRRVHRVDANKKGDQRKRFSLLLGC